MNDKYGILLNDNTKLHRRYFHEMLSLIGIQVIYRAPYEGKQYTTYGEIDTNYEEPILVGCLFYDHPDQKTLRKLGWVSELQENSSLIEVEYDLPNLQQGSLFIIPSGLDDGNARIFKVVNIKNSIVYPASVTCEIVPEFENTMNKETDLDYSHSSFNLLNREDGELDYIVEEV